MTELITGATGFIGGRLLTALRRDGARPRIFARRPVALGDDVETATGALDDAEAVARACAGVEVVYHCAGYAHADRDPRSAALHREINREGARIVAEAAARAGVRRMVLLSSVKAMGPTGAAPADEDWPVAPSDDYGCAKRAAEQAVAAIDGLESCRLRLAMVYGAGGRGNLERMARLVARGLFPPPPETGNRRSLVHVDDVVAAMRLAARHPAAADATFIVAHPRAHSGRELFDALRRALGMSATRLATPAWALNAAAWTGEALERRLALRAPINRQAIERLLGDACYSPARLEAALGWRAETSLDAGLAEMLGADGRVAA